MGCRARPCIAAGRLIPLCTLLHKCDGDVHITQPHGFGVPITKEARTLSQANILRPGADPTQSTGVLCKHFGANTAERRMPAFSLARFQRGYFGGYSRSFYFKTIVLKVAYIAI